MAANCDQVAFWVAFSDNKAAKQKERCLVGLNKATYSFRALLDLFFYGLVILRGGFIRTQRTPPGYRPAVVCKRSMHACI